MTDVCCQHYATQTPSFGPGACQLFSACLQILNLLCCLLRWLDLFFWGVYAPTLSVNHVGINKDIGKRLPQLHCIKMKIYYDPCFIDIRVTMATSWRHYVFYLPLYFSVLGVFFRNRLRELVSPLVASVVARFEQILWERFGNISKQSFKGHKNSK